MGEMSEIVERAARFARMAHEGQKRKYTGEPYFTHVQEVARLIKDHSALLRRSEMIAAAYLHDVLEDTATTEAELRKVFPAEVVGIVAELTDVYTSAAFPHLNRRTRKMMEAERLAFVSAEAQTVKCADIISNTKTIAKYDPKFAPVYLAEKRDLLRGLSRAEPELLARAEAWAREG